MRILKQMIPMILIYLIMFAGFSILFTTMNASSNSFSVQKTNIAVIDRDNSSFSNNFYKYIDKNSSIVKIKDNNNLLKDALFYQQADYIMIIPKGYGNDFMNNGDMKIKTMKRANSTSSYYADMLYVKYLDTARIYQQAGFNVNDINKKINDSLSHQAIIKLYNKKQNNFDGINYMFNFCNYVILGLLMMSVGLVLRSYNDPHIKNRNTISSCSYKKMNFQLFLGHATMMLVFWLVYVVEGIVLYREALFSLNGILWLINLMAFSIMALSLSILIGNMIKERQAHNAVVNIVSLGTSFLCGAFVPQRYLSSFVLSISKIFPSYWFIKNNNDIALMSNVSIGNIRELLPGYGIMIGFGIIMFILNNVISRKKLRDSK